MRLHSLSFSSLLLQIPFLTQCADTELATRAGPPVQASATHAALSGWGSPVRLDAGGGDAEAPRVAAGGAGRAVTVWAQSNGAGYSLWAARWRIGSGWRSPEPVDDGRLGDARAPAVAIAAGGLAIAWERRNGERTTVWGRGFVEGNGWTDPVELDGGGLAREPVVAIDDRGNVTIAWTRTELGSDYVSAVHFARGLDWSAPEELEAAGRHPRLAASGGRVLLAWQQPGELDTVWAARCAGSWRTPEQLSPVGFDARRPEVALDALGRGVVIWEQRDLDGGSLVWASHAMERNWSLAAPISTEVVSAGALTEAIVPTVGIDADCGGVALWLQTDDRMATGWSNKFARCGAWDAPSPVLGAADAHAPRLAVANAGMAAATWWVAATGIPGDVLATRYVAGSWIEPERLDAEGVDALDPDIAAGGGRLVAAWVQWQETHYAIWARVADGAVVAR